MGEPTREVVVDNATQVVIGAIKAGVPVIVLNDDEETPQE